MLPVKSFSQDAYIRLLDSLNRLATPIDRARAFHGRGEELRLFKSNLENYLADVEKIANEKNDNFLFDNIYHIRNNWGKSSDLENTERLFKYYTIAKKDLYIGYLYHSQAQIDFAKQEYGNAFENYFRAEKIYKKIGYENVPTIGKFLHDFALSRYYFKDYKAVISLMRESIKYKPFNSNHDIQRFNNLGSSYMYLGKKDSAQYFYTITFELAKKYENTTWKGIVYGNLGSLHYKNTNYNEALKNFFAEYEINKNSEYDPIKITSNTNIAKTYLKLGQTDKSKEYIKKVETILKNLQKDKSFGDNQQLETLKRDYFELKSSMLIHEGNYSKALLFKDSLNYYQRKIDSVYNSAVVDISSDRLTIENKELELQQKEQEKTKQNIFYACIILAVLLVSTIISYYLYKSRKKKSDQATLLIQENQKSNLEKQQIEKDLELAEKEINKFITKINEQNKVVTQFENDLKKLKDLEIDQSNKMRETLNEIKSKKILTDDNWLDFLTNFDKIHPDFRQQLELKAPTPLTASETRYLMLSKLNFNHKEMARALGISDSAVRVTWNRVRKKLNGTLEDNASTLLERIIGN